MLVAKFLVSLMFITREPPGRFGSLVNRLVRMSIMLNTHLMTTLS